MEVSPAAHAAALWTGLTLALLLVLSVRVVRLRRKHGVALGHGEAPELERAIRAFGNASEYAPAAIGALAVLALVGANALLVNAAGLLLFVGRLIHAIGLSRSAGASPARASGTVMTWLAYILAAAALIFFAIP